MRKSQIFSIAIPALIVVGVLLRPITETRTWLELSRGISVLDGTFRPSQAMLVNELNADANWLSGVPFAIAFTLLEAHGLMLMKFLGGVFAAAIFWRMCGEIDASRKGGLLGLGFLASLVDWDVSPHFWDMLGLVMLIWCLRANGSKLWPALSVLGGWSHMGELVVVGLTFWAVARFFGSPWQCPPTSNRWPDRALVIQRLGEILMAIGVCSLNPRGVLSLCDSLRMAVPLVACESVTLLDTEWQSLLTGTWNVSSGAFAVLTILSLLELPGRASSVSFTVLTLMSISLGWLCQANVGLSGICLSFLLARCRPNTTDSLSASAVDDVSRLVRSRFAVPPLHGRLGWIMIPMVIIVWWPIEGHRPGWGLDSRLDERLLAQALSKIALTGTAWADDELSAGMCLWVTHQRLKVHDTPRRALLGGRFKDFISLRSDLEHGRLAEYRRDDHLAGGWWLPLRERDTSLLFVSADNESLLRALEPTFWKPLALDSPVFPMGQSGTPQVAPQILEVLRQRNFLEHQPWRQTLLGPKGTDRFWDLWGNFGVLPNIEQELRFARVFRALHLPNTALAILELAARASRSRSIEREISECRRELSSDPVAESHSRAVELTVVPPQFNRCVDCHAEQSAQFATTGHHNTLKPLDHQLTQELLGDSTFDRPLNVLGVRFWNETNGGQFVSASSQTVTGIPSQWLFGSGKHARTPVSIWLGTDDLALALEHRLSWYPDHGWSATLGLNQPLELQTSPAGFVAKDRRTALESLGKIHDPAATRDCFGCHTTHSPLKNAPHSMQGMPIVPGVSCDRCHPGSEPHAHSRESGSLDTPHASWQTLTPLELVNRCGECHRRADHLTPDELHPDNSMLIRFASVGLVQSECFRRQETVKPEQLPENSRHRFDCLTCHDPHRPAKSDPKFYSARCTACHNAAATTCSQQPLESNCLPCHMPKVEVQSPLRFTDHWIRVRKSSRAD